MSFNPASIANLWGWYDAGQGVIGGTSVTEWMDSSTNENDLAPTAPNRQPQQLTNVINGLPVVALKTGGLARLVTAGNFPFVNGATVFMVASQINTNDASGTFIEYSQGSAIERSNAGTGISTDLNGVTLVTTGATNGQFYTIRTLASNSTVNLYMNGSLQNTGTTPNPVVQQPLNVFQMHDGSNNGNKQFAEIILFSRQLNTTECGQVETYLRTKYAHY